jgi:hypothetical protein
MGRVRGYGTGSGLFVGRGNAGGLFVGIKIEDSVV